MLDEFLDVNRDELATRCRAKVAGRMTPGATPADIEYGIPLFIQQLVQTLRDERLVAPERALGQLSPSIRHGARSHGNELLRKGYTVDQVVHDYGDLCQAVTELAHECKEPITVREFRTLNRCLDDAIAGAVTEFGNARDRDIFAAGTQTMNERLGYLAHELRNHLNTATLAFEAIKSGSVAPAGATGAALDRSLLGLRTLIDRSLADVRLTAGLPIQREAIELADLFTELRVPVSMEAKARELELVTAAEAGLVVDADRPMLSAAIANLLQNALKFTRPRTRISLSARRAGDRILIAIEDECGGLPPGGTAQLFQPFAQRGDDRTGLGLGLSISRRSVEANGGTLEVRDLPGIGCIFTVSLPRATGDLAVVSTLH